MKFKNLLLACLLGCIFAVNAQEQPRCDRLCDCNTDPGNSSWLHGETIVHGEHTEYIRFYSKAKNEYGCWITTMADIAPNGALPCASEIRNRYSIPYMPDSYEILSNIPADRGIYKGIAAPLDAPDGAHLNGGGLQYCIIGNLECDWFNEGRKIPACLQ